MLSNLSCGALMSYTDHSAQSSFKSNTPNDGGVFSDLGPLSKCSRRGPHRWTSVNFAIDSGVGMGIVYILSILIQYLSIQLSILLSIIWCKNK